MANDRNKAVRGESVVLSIQYYGTDGLSMDADSTPQIRIANLDGDLILAPTATGVTRVDVGLYEYSFSVGAAVGKGLWTDTWQASIGGAILSNEFKFLVTDEASAVEHLGLQVKLVKGQSDNIKITHAEDLELATAIFKIINQ